MKIPVGILGATGVVGQRFVDLLDQHPWFEVGGLAASGRSSGKRYADACRWLLPGEMPSRAAELLVQPVEDLGDFPLIFSALPAAIAGEVETDLASAGSIVCSNASAHRLDNDVPLIIPEINADHVALLSTQREKRRWRGAIVCSPNCSTTQLALALHPVAEKFGLRAFILTTMQAISGAGYPGVAALDIEGNIIPYIDGEEEKLKRELVKLLGTLRGDSILPAVCEISATCTRVPVREGHMMTVSMKLGEEVPLADVADCLVDFQGEGKVRSLPSSPASPIRISKEVDRPQPILDLARGDGMVITLGRLRPCPVLDVQFVLLGHNTIRGAAGGAIHNAEYLRSTGWLN